jgi:glutathione S-transferase
MADFVIHSSAGSTLGRAVVMALLEKSSSFRLALLPPKELPPTRHALKHPWGRMPVLEHGTFLLYETQAILRYIDRILPQPPLTPSEPRAAAKMDQVMNLNDWYLAKFERLVGPRLLGLNPYDMQVVTALPEAAQVFEVMAAQLAGKAYFAGPSVSLADVLLAPQFDNMARGPSWTTLTSRHENLIKWLARMNERDSMRRSSWELLDAGPGRD